MGREEEEEEEREGVGGKRRKRGREWGGKRRKRGREWGGKRGRKWGGKRRKRGREEEEEREGRGDESKLCTREPTSSLASMSMCTWCSSMDMIRVAMRESRLVSPEQRHIAQAIVNSQTSRCPLISMKSLNVGIL